MTKWGGDLSQLDFDDIYYYVKASDRSEQSWDDVPDDIKKTFDRLGIPEAERKFLAGVGAQYDSEVVYHNIVEELDKIGVVFLDTDTAVKEYPDLVKKYFGTIIPSADNQFAALNSAAWSGWQFRLCSTGCEGRISSASLFPDQQREHGAIRAYAHHR